MGWFLAILLFSLISGSVSEVEDNKFSSDVVVGGIVICDICSEHDFTPKTHFISGAKVGVECKVEHSTPSFKEEVETDKYGEFKVKLPFKVRRHAKIINGCTFKLISSSEPHCDVPVLSTSSSVSLITTKEGERIFSAGFFSFKPKKKPSFCNKKLSVSNPSLSDEKSEVDTFFPPLPFLPPFPSLPPFPFLPPIPFLPPFPFLPPIPFLPPNPFHPPTPIPPPSPPLPPKTPVQPTPSPLLPPYTPSPVQPPISPVQPPRGPSPPSPSPVQPPISPSPPSPSPVQPPKRPSPPSPSPVQPPKRPSPPSPSPVQPPISPSPPSPQIPSASPTPSSPLAPPTQSPSPSSPPLSAPKSSNY